MEIYVEDRKKTKKNVKNKNMTNKMKINKNGISFVNSPFVAQK